MAGKIEQEEITVRHIVPCLPGDDGAVQVMGTYFRPLNTRRLNDVRGWQSGRYQRRLYEEGDFSLVLPNIPAHRKRFGLWTNDTYRVGDEWIEVKSDRESTPLFVGSPEAGQRRRSDVEISGQDALGWLKHTRETAAGFWPPHAPRDVFEHYTRLWRAYLADDFRSGGFTLSSSPQAHGGGQWSYQRAETNGADPDGSIILRPTTSVASWIRGTEGIPAGTAASDPHQPWRYEVELQDINAVCGIGLVNAGVTPAFLGTELQTAFYVVPVGTFLELGPDELAVGDDTSIDKVMVQGWATKKTHQLAIEGRGRWLFFYVDGVLVQVRPMFVGSSSVVPAIVCHPHAAVGATTVTVKSALLRSAIPGLLRGAAKGDYHLPGAPTPGGLVGTYFDEQPVTRNYSFNTALIPPNLLKPTLEPAARRIDATINFTSAGVVTWPASGLKTNFTVRWAGAIYLDLAGGDILVRTRADDRVRVWIGKTRFGEQIINDWTTAGHAITTTTSGSLRTHLGTQQAGWYPIVIEYSQGTGDGQAIFEWSSNGGGAWSVVPADKLSPLGCYEGQIRYESHYEMLRQLMATFGFQATVEPRSLESGEFPGQLIPRVRQGRDTAFVLDDAIDATSNVTAADAVDVLLADAQGLATADQSLQLTAERINYGELRDHVMVHQEYEQQSDISIPALLQQRLDSLLALRGSPWEEVAASPTTRRELVDRWPLTGQLAKFAWEPGDGLRLDIEHLDVTDTVCRQILGAEWMLTRAGRRKPAVSFKQRPRDNREYIRRLQRQVLSSQRYYQGQIAIVNSGIGSAVAIPAIPDIYCRLALPAGRDRCLKATLVVLRKPGVGVYNIEINGTNRATFDTVGRYDITRFIGSSSSSSHPYYMYARASPVGAADAEAPIYQVELEVAVGAQTR